MSDRSNMQFEAISNIAIFEAVHWYNKDFSCYLRNTSAVKCEVSLPQHSDSNPICKVLRNAALAENKKTYTYKYDPELHGFALVNMTSAQLGDVALKDPFMRYFTTAYVGMTSASNKLFETYTSMTAGQEIDNISDYLELSKFFQSTLEPAVGVNIRFFVAILDQWEARWPHDLAGDIALCSWARHFNLTVPLSTQV